MYLTYDIGTSALKTALVDKDGLLAAIDVREYTPVSPSDGLLEMPVNVYWQALIDGTRAVFGESRTSPSEISAIGLSSQGQTFIPIDSQGRPLHDAIVWLDNRAQAVADSWSQEWLSDEVFRTISGYPKIPAELTVFKVAWMLEHLPETRRAWKFLCLSDYVIYRLCNATVTDPVIAQMTGFCDISTQQWSPRMLAAAGVSSDQLPLLAEAGTVAGTILRQVAEELGLPTGVPVCVGTNDQIAGAIGAGNVLPGIVTETTGTALAAVVTSSNMWNDERLLVGHHAIRGSFFALAYGVTSAVVLKWFRDMVSPHESYEQLLAEIDTVRPGCDGLTLLPHFAGTGTPWFNPDARGAMVGLTLSHGRAHIARAIMESCACLLRECLEPICSHSEISVVRALGGAARTDLWLQMKADMLGIPIEKPMCSDASSLGAAMIAASGTGQFSSIAEASDAWYQSTTVYEPDVEKYSAYEDVYARYCTIYDRLYGSPGRTRQAER